VPTARPATTASAATERLNMEISCLGRADPPPAEPN
jgi:hypothetical protein